MDKIVIKGGKKLQGKVRTSGAKNSSLPLLFSTLLAEGEHVFENVPSLKDIDSTIMLLEMLGAKVKRDGDKVIINSKLSDINEATYDVVRKMRASILCLGPLVAKRQRARVSLPGGCAIGTRPIDIHLEGMKALGAEVDVNGGYVEASCSQLKGASILFDNPTVGGTENIMMAASLADGKTIIENAAKEPEIVDLADYLNKMGAKIYGAGSSIITIQGVNKLTPATHQVIPDRIEAGTLLIAGAITGGEVTVTDCNPNHLDALAQKLKESGFRISTTTNSITVEQCDEWRGVDITTAPHPGFPTDLQAQFMALMAVASGVSVITETIFENRFMHVQELVRLGSDITPKSRVAIVRGQPKKLVGAPVMATDLRASASLVLAGLAAKGQTEVARIYHLDRGYENMEKKLSSLRADIRRIQ
ncbi:MAG: UDP-N-acetylglucosamine 1-carboxyvinyltransferase [Proteobacteria bacterium SG_bin7]|nr:MAG: UDP-N-acetylglucosamine 1-carboxyvinyltransferase [Proteobacteria bacterium SG_bin7]